MLVQGRLPTEYTCFAQLSIGHNVHRMGIVSMPGFHGGHLAMTRQDFSTFWKRRHFLHFRSAMMHVLKVAERPSLVADASIHLVMIERKGIGNGRSVRKVRLYLSVCMCLSTSTSTYTYIY